MRRAITTLLLSGTLLAIATVPADAQLRRTRHRGAIGLYGAVARPVGEFQNFVDWGGGVSLYGLLNVDRGGHLGLRTEGSFLVYGHERYAVPFSSYVSRVWLDLTTDNMIASLAAGPQLTLGSGGFRPYAFGTVGFSYFATVSSVSGTASDEPFASSTNFDDVTLALSWGGGVLTRLHRGRLSVWLDLGVQSTRNGEAEYLREGGVVDNLDGSVTLYPIRSEANLVTFRVGVAVGL